MENSEEKQPEEVLRDKLVEAEEIGEEIASQGRDITQEGQWIADYAKATRGITDCAPQFLDIESQIDFLEDINTSGRASLQGLLIAQEPLFLLSATSSTAATNVAISISSSEQLIPCLTSEMQEPTKIAISNFHHFSSRSEVKEEVISLMQSFGLDKGVQGKISPLELFLTAHQAFERPVSDTDPVSTSLIPMRESISSIVAELLRRRPIQEKAGSNYDKVLSFGIQLKRDELSENVVREWASQWDKLANELSQAKQGMLSREEWNQRLQRATLFLNGLLKGLDPSKI